MYIIIGLGNPENNYQATRHNVGQMLIDRLPTSPHYKTFKTDTYMNESGIFVQKTVRFYKVPLDHLILIHDDLDLGVGEYRCQFDRGPAGHHGVESTIQHLNSQAFWRYRLGIGHPLDNLPVEKYVLQPFTATEKSQIDQVIDKVVAEIQQLPQ